MDPAQPLMMTYLPSYGELNANRFFNDLNMATAQDFNSNFKSSTYCGNIQLEYKSTMNTVNILKSYIDKSSYKIVLNCIHKLNFIPQKKEHLFYSFFLLGCEELNIPCKPFNQEMSILTKSPFLEALRGELSNIPQCHIPQIAWHCLIDNILYCICTINSFDISTASSDGESLFDCPNLEFQLEAIPYFFSIFPQDFNFEAIGDLFFRFVEYYKINQSDYDIIKETLPGFLQNKIPTKNYQTKP